MKRRYTLPPLVPPLAELSAILHTSPPVSPQQAQGGIARIPPVCQFQASTILIAPAAAPLADTVPLA